MFSAKNGYTELSLPAKPQGSAFTVSTFIVDAAGETHQGKAFSSQWVYVPPRVLSLSLEVQGLFQGLILGWLLGVCLSGTSGKHTQITYCFSVSRPIHQRDCKQAIKLAKIIWIWLFLIIWFEKKKKKHDAQATIANTVSQHWTRILTANCDGCL